MAANWLYSVDSEGVRVTPEFMDRLSSGDATAMRALQKANLTLQYRIEFTRAPRRNDADGLFWTVPKTALIPFVRAGRHSPTAWIKAEVLVETVKAKKNTYEPPNLVKQGTKRMVSFVQTVRKSMKGGEETVLMNIDAGSVSAWKMMPNPNFELVVINKYDKAALLKLLDELDSAANVAQWLDERTVRQGATAHKPLFEDYVSWCGQCGETAAGKRKFSEALIAAGVTKLTRSNAAQRYELELRPI
jgi:hypothetical protein